MGVLDFIQHTETFAENHSLLNRQKRALQRGGGGDWK